MAAILIKIVCKIQSWLPTEINLNTAIVATPRTRYNQQDAAARCAPTWTPTYKSHPGMYGYYTEPVPSDAGG